MLKHNVLWRKHCHTQNFHRAHEDVLPWSCRAGLFIYFYCFYYYLARSDMSGFMQSSFFFGAHGFDWEIGPGHSLHALPP